MTTAMCWVRGRHLTVGVALLTTWTSTGEAELYCAVMLWEPTERLEVVNVTIGSLMTAVPMTVPRQGSH